LNFGGYILRGNAAETNSGLFPSERRIWLPRLIATSVLSSICALRLTLRASVPAVLVPSFHSAYPDGGGIVLLHPYSIRDQ
jgi:hypothetical protein